MEAHDEGVAAAMARANEVFTRLVSVVEEAVTEAPSEPIVSASSSRCASAATSAARRSPR
jgi:hypothetical protein